MSLIQAIRLSCVSNLPLHATIAGTHATIAGMHATIAGMIVVMMGCWCSATAASPATSGNSSSSPSRTNRISVYPESVSLHSARDFQSLIAVLQQADGTTTDVTDQVQWSVQNSKLASMEDNRAIPLANGNSEIIATLDESTVRVPLRVSGASDRPRIRFEKDVMPVLTRAGCNSGSCHGASRGKDGFRLSLFGFDPTGDYHRITRQESARRINLAIPHESLRLKKSIGAVPHSGGKRFGDTSDYYQTILEWLQDGALADDEALRAKSNNAVTDDSLKATSLVLYPPKAVIQGQGAQQQMVAVATYADGTTRDVTQLASFTSNNSSIAAIDDEGTVAAGMRGEAFVMARFGTHTVGSQILTLPKELQFTAKKTNPNAGYIDRLVDRKLSLLRIVPSGPCDDQTFLRRTTIDIVGLLPTQKEYEQFVRDPAPDKRARLIDQLLQRKEFSEIWAMKFAQLLMIKSTNQVSYKSAFLYANWLTDQFARGVPINKIVQELLTSSGGTFSSPATNFYEIERDTLKTSENVAQVFLGIRTQCAQCHNHPFDRWTMDDYYGFASFFAQVGRKSAEDYRERIVFNRFKGEVKHPLTQKKAVPTFLGAEQPNVRGKDRRDVLAQWLTSDDNPYFAKSIANRVWAHFMGVGIVEPVDDIRVSNPATNPELLEELGHRLVEYDFDFRSLVRDICNSEAYGRSAETNLTNAHDHRNYASAVIRRIPAENLLDCLSAVTESPDKFRGLPLGSRAVQIADGTTSNYFLDAFGRSKRTTACECEATTSPSLSQALHLLNGDSVHRKIGAGKLIKRWRNKQKLPSDRIIDQIFVRSLSRHPNEDEKTRLIEEVESSEDQTAALEDVFWAVLNSREFVFNH